MILFMKPILTAAGILAILIIAALVAGSFYFYNAAIRRSRKEFLRDDPDLADTFKNAGSAQQEQDNEDFQPTPVFLSQWADSQSYETWNITSGDGLKLVGYYLPAALPTNKAIILAHGYTSRGKDMGGFARYYYEKLGYNVLMPDARGHGDSEGRYIGFGWHERKDYQLWIQKIIDRIGGDAQIVLYGISMGGATVMMVSGEALPKQVKAVVEDCGYTSVSGQLGYLLKRRYHLPRFPLLQLTSLVTKLRAGYYFGEASAFKQVTKAKIPILFIHGEADTFVPAEMVRQLYDACTAEKDIFIVRDAGHGMAYGTAGPEYERKVSAFISRYLS